MLATKPKREVEGVYQKLLSRFIYANAKSNQKLAHCQAAKDRYNHHYAKGKPTIFYLRYLISFVKSIILKMIEKRFTQSSKNLSYLLNSTLSQNTNYQQKEMNCKKEKKS